MAEPNQAPPVLRFTNLLFSLVARLYLLFLNNFKVSQGEQISDITCYPGDLSVYLDLR